MVEGTLSKLAIASKLDALRCLFIELMFDLCSTYGVEVGELTCIVP